MQITLKLSGMVVVDHVMHITLKLSGMVVVDHVMQLQMVIPTVVTASKQLQHTHKSAKLAHTKLVAINVLW